MIARFASVGCFGEPWALPIHFDEWRSFAWELPLFWWFLGLALALGTVLAVIFRMVQRKDAIMSLTPISPVLAQSMAGRSTMRTRHAARPVAGS